MSVHVLMFVREVGGLIGHHTRYATTRVAKDHWLRGFVLFVVIQKTTIMGISFGYEDDWSDGVG